MGYRQEWSCNKCDFQFCGEGHNSAVMAGTTTSTYCEDCEHVMDLLTGPEGREIPGAPLECYESKTHKVRAWTVEEPCPKCGKGTLVADPHSGMLTD